MAALLPSPQFCHHQLLLVTSYQSGLHQILCSKYLCGFLQSVYHILSVCKSFPSTIINLLETGSLCQVHRSQPWQNKIPQKGGGCSQALGTPWSAIPSFSHFLADASCFNLTYLDEMLSPYIPLQHLIHSFHTWDGCLRNFLQYTLADP